MKKICKKLLIILMALALSVSAFALGACSYSGKGLDGDYSGEVASQGGWVVQKGDYVYFINGSTVAPTDEAGNAVAYENKYGDAVRGALMRIKVSDMNEGNYGGAETVVPLLMVASDYSSGVYIYGDYVYYATPTTAKNLEGETESNYLDFKRSRLDGRETMKNYYFRSENPSAEYRFVEVGGVVYCLHAVENDLYSFNTETGADTLLAKNTRAHLFHKTDLSDPYVYYTMNVVQGIDQNNPVIEDYTQIYRVRADASYELDVNGNTASYTVKDGASAYEYTYNFDKDSLERLSQENDEYDFSANRIETYPYVNLGQAVLDGVGSNNEPTQYNHSQGAPETPDGYTYTLLGYENGGLYYRKQYVSGTGSTGEGGWTFYLDLSNIGADWNVVAGNAAEFNDRIALTVTNVNSSAIFYIKDGTHYYLYINGSNIVRAEVNADGSANEVTIARSVSANSLLYLDNTSSDVYKYVYYTVSSENGIGMGRAVYDSTASDYNDRAESYYYNAIVGPEEYKPVQILNIDHPADWYAPELIDGRIYFVDTATVGSDALDNAHVVSLQSSGIDKVMNNKEIKEYNELLEKTRTALSEASVYSGKVGNALYYYYYTGESELFQEVIDDYVDSGDGGEYSLFSADEQEYFYAYVQKTAFNKGSTSVDFATLLVKEDGTYYGVRSYFYHTIGVLSEEEEAELEQVWKQTYLSAPEETENDGLPAWAWALIGIAIGIGVIGIVCGVTVPLVLRAEKKRIAAENAEPQQKEYTVDMSYNEDIDVYAPETPVQEEKAEENPSAEEPVKAAEESVEAAAETLQAESGTETAENVKPDVEAEADSETKE